MFLFGLLLFVIAGVGVWYTVTRTDYLPKLAVYLVKLAIPIIFKSEDPKVLEKWREVQREGGEWDYLNKRPKDKR